MLFQTHPLAATSNRPKTLLYALGFLLILPMPRRGEKRQAAQAVADIPGLPVCCTGPRSADPAAIWGRDGPSISSWSDLV